jgi:DNA-binding MarR family transcriptional regulator
VKTDLTTQSGIFKLRAHTASGPDIALNELHSRLSFLIRQADRDITRRFVAKFGSVEAVAQGALNMLILIGASPGLDQQQIANYLDLDKGNAARQIRSLDEAGWLIRKHDTDDHRKQGVFLSPEGAKELAKIKRDVRLFENELVEPFTDIELAELVRLLNKLHASNKQSSITE